MEKPIEISEIPISMQFVFLGTDESAYRIQFEKIKIGFHVYIYRGSKLIYIGGINWTLPPDYLAAKELIEIYLQNGKI